MTGPPFPRAAVFDCDGLLVDTAACWWEAFGAASGRQLGPGELAALAGASVGSGARILSRRLGTAVDPAAVAEMLLAAATRLEPRALPGAERVLRSLHRRVPLAVATNGPADFVETVLDRAGLRRYVDAVVTSEAAGADKPDPAVYRTACATLGEPPQSAVAFEDSEVGAESARAAGCFVVVVGRQPATLVPDLQVPRLDDPAVAEVLGRRRS